MKVHEKSTAVWDDAARRGKPAPRLNEIFPFQTDHKGRRWITPREMWTPGPLSEGSEKGIGPGIRISWWYRG